MIRMVKSFADRLWERVHPPAAPAVVAPPPRPAPVVPDVAALVREELARKEADQAALDEAERSARFAGGPCYGCGVTLSWLRQDYVDAPSEDVPAWYSFGRLPTQDRRPGPGRGQVLCWECDDDRGTAVAVEDFKGYIALCLLRSVGRAGMWTGPSLGLRLGNVPILHGEHSPAPATHVGEQRDTAIRYNFVNVDSILAAVAPPGLARFSGPACAGCGCSDWVRRPGGLTYMGPETGNLDVEPYDVCVGCGGSAPTRNFWYIDDDHPGGQLRASNTVDPAAPVSPRVERAELPSWMGSLDPTHQGN